MTPIEFTILGRAQQRGSKQASLVPKRGGGWLMRDGRPVVVARDMNRKSKEWMQEVRCVAAGKMGGSPLIAVPVVLTARFYFVRPKSHFRSGRHSGHLRASAPAIHGQSPDLAKLLRSLEDALTGVVWVDDRLVCAYGEGTGRYWTTSQERTEVVITEAVG